MRKILMERRWAVALGGAVVLAVVAYLVLTRSHAVQDWIVERAVTRVVGGQSAETYGKDKLELVFCGTASPMGNSDRAQQCSAVLAGDKFFLVDSGAGAANRIGRLGLPTERLTGVLLTHFHSDHIADLGEVHLASWVRGRPTKLDVYGGPGIEKVVDGFNLAYAADSGYRTAHHGNEIMPIENAGLMAREVNPPESGSQVFYQADGLTISVFQVLHPPIRPAFGYRFDYRGRSIVVSGDTVESDNLAEVAENADVLVHEVLQPQLVELLANGIAQAGNENLAQLLRDTLDYHTSPTGAAAIANRANVDTLVFTHLAPVPRNNLMERIFLRGVADIRPQSAILAEDGMHIVLPAPTQGSSDVITIE